MAVPQRPNPRASGTGIVACAGLSYCKAASSKDSTRSAYNYRAFVLAEWWLAAAQPGMAVPQRPNLRVVVKAERRAGFA